MYNSQQRAYQGRRVIKQLLDNESKKHTGRSAGKHFFKSYNMNPQEWQDVNELNGILKVRLPLIIFLGFSDEIWILIIIIIQ